MLKKFKTTDRELCLGFELKTAGKFRIKERKDNEILSTFSPVVPKDNLNQTSFYIEWQISYYIKSDSVKPNTTLINKDREILLPSDDNNQRKTKSVYLAELSELLNQAIKLKIITKGEVENLMNWVCSVLPDEYLDETILNHKITGNNGISVKEVKDLMFNISFLTLPYCILKNQDKTWVEVVKEKQQYAYSFQPMIYLCIPDEILKFYDGLFWWVISRENFHAVTNVFKVFALSSKRHNRDVCYIIRDILKYC